MAKKSREELEASEQLFHDLKSVVDGHYIPGQGESTARISLRDDLRIFAGIERSDDDYYDINELVSLVYPDAVVKKASDSSPKKPVAQKGE